MIKNHILKHSLNARQCSMLWASFKSNCPEKIVDSQKKKKIETHYKISKLDDLSQGPGL